MTSDEVREICNERLTRWRDHLVSKHATPMVLIGVGHDEAEGSVVMCLPDGINGADVAGLLAGVFEMLIDRKYEEGKITEDEVAG